MPSQNPPKYYHQLGHNDQKRCLELLYDGYGAGAILSPLNLSRGESTLQKYAGEYRATNTELFVDPQLYASETIRSEKYPISDTRDLARNLSLGFSVLEDSLKQQMSLAPSHILIPVPFFDLPTEDFSTLLLAFSEKTLSWIDDLGENISAFATVPISTATIVDDEARVRLLNNQWCGLETKLSDG